MKQAATSKIIHLIVFAFFFCFFFDSFTFIQYAFPASSKSSVSSISPVPSASPSPSNSPGYTAKVECTSSTKCWGKETDRDYRKKKCEIGCYYTSGGGTKCENHTDHGIYAKWCETTKECLTWPNQKCPSLKPTPSPSPTPVQKCGTGGDYDCAKDPKTGNVIPEWQCTRSCQNGQCVNNGKNWCPEDTYNKCHAKFMSCSCSANLSCWLDSNGKLDPKRECELVCNNRGKCIPSGREYCPDDPNNKCHEAGDKCYCSEEKDCHKDKDGQTSQRKVCERTCDPVSKRCVDRNPKKKWCELTKKCYDLDKFCCEQADWPRSPVGCRNIEMFGEKVNDSPARQSCCQMRDFCYRRGGSESQKAICDYDLKMCLQASMPGVSQEKWDEWYKNNFRTGKLLNNKVDFRYHQEKCTCNVYSTEKMFDQYLDGAKIIDSCCDDPAGGCKDGCVVQLPNTMTSWGQKKTYGCVHLEDIKFVPCQPGVYGPCEFKDTGCAQCRFTKVTAVMERSDTMLPSYLSPPGNLIKLLSKALPGSCGWTWPFTFKIHHPILVLKITALCPADAQWLTTKEVNFDVRIHGGLPLNEAFTSRNLYPVSEHESGAAVCEIGEYNGIDGQRLISAAEALCSRAYGPFKFFSCNCGDFFLLALDALGIPQFDILNNRKCEWNTDDCQIYSWEFNPDEPGGCVKLRPSGVTAPQAAQSANCPSVPDCANSCQSCSGCPLNASLCNQGFCLDDYPPDVRAKLIEAINSKDNLKISSALNDMFGQSCSHIDLSRLKVNYGFSAPNLPDGTSPLDDCFSNLAPRAREYWRNEYQKRKKCGIWIKIEGD